MNPGGAVAKQFQVVAHGASEVSSEVSRSLPKSIPKKSPTEYSHFGVSRTSGDLRKCDYPVSVARRLRVGNMRAGAARFG